MVGLNGVNDPLPSGQTDFATDNLIDDFSMDGREDDAWLETHLIAGFRVWQILLLAGTILTTIVTFLCCCIRFRIPRTKQEIESDWERREMAKEFERRMKKIIGHEEGSKLDLRKALERVHADVIREEEERRRRKEMEEEVRIRIREGASDGCDGEKGRRWKGEHGKGNLNETNGDGKGVPELQTLGWKTTGLIARVFFNSNRRERK